MTVGEDGNSSEIKAFVVAACVYSRIQKATTQDNFPNFTNGDVLSCDHGWAIHLVGTTSYAEVANKHEEGIEDLEGMEKSGYNGPGGLVHSNNLLYYIVFNS